MEMFEYCVEQFESILSKFIRESDDAFDYSNENQTNTPEITSTESEENNEHHVNEENEVHERSALESDKGKPDSKYTDDEDDEDENDDKSSDTNSDNDSESESEWIHSIYDFTGRIQIPRLEDFNKEEIYFMTSMFAFGSVLFSNLPFIIRQTIVFLHSVFGATIVSFILVSMFMHYDKKSMYHKSHMERFLQEEEEYRDTYEYKYKL